MITAAARRITTTAAHQRAQHNTARRMGLHYTDIQKTYWEDLVSPKSFIRVGGLSDSPRQDGLMFDLYDFGQMQ